MFERNGRKIDREDRKGFQLFGNSRLLSRPIGFHRFQRNSFTIPLQTTSNKRIADLKRERDELAERVRQLESERVHSPLANLSRTIEQTRERDALVQSENNLRKERDSLLERLRQTESSKVHSPFRTQPMDLSKEREQVVQAELEVTKMKLQAAMEEILSLRNLLEDIGQWSQVLSSVFCPFMTCFSSFAPFKRAVW